MITVKNIFDFLCSKFPLETACDFDNAGLLVGDGNNTVTKVLICLDCDKNAVLKAKELSCELIISHHPVIFDGLKSVVANQVVYELVKSGVSVISMHTNLDIASDGVSENLCKALGLRNIMPYTAEDGFVLRSGETDFTSPSLFAKHIKEKLDTAVRFTDCQRPIKKVLVCSGSGGDFLDDAIMGGFDALVTADVKHNVFISAVNNDFPIFDAGHYQTENIILKPLKALCEKEFKDTEFVTFNSGFIKFV